MMKQLLLQYFGHAVCEDDGYFLAVCTHVNSDGAFWLAASQTDLPLPTAACPHTPHHILTKGRPFGVRKSTAEKDAHGSDTKSVHVLRQHQRARNKRCGSKV
jgi:hypothetical protein